MNARVAAIFSLSATIVADGKEEETFFGGRGVKE